MLSMAPCIPKVRSRSVANESWQYLPTGGGNGAFGLGEEVSDASAAESKGGGPWGGGGFCH